MKCKYCYVYFGIYNIFGVMKESIGKWVFDIVNDLGVINI